VNDDLMFEYLVKMGAMQPEEEQLMRKQQMVDALRNRSMESPQGQMVGKHYVAPSFTQYAGQLANAYGARKGQESADQKSAELNMARRQVLMRMGDFRKAKTSMENVDPSSFYKPDEEDILRGYSLPRL
jgi:hypothetical protein